MEPDPGQRQEYRQGIQEIPVHLLQEIPKSPKRRKDARRIVRALSHGLPIPARAGHRTAVSEARIHAVRIPADRREAEIPDRARTAEADSVTDRAPDQALRRDSARIHGRVRKDVLEQTAVPVLRGRVPPDAQTEALHRI